MIKQVVDVTYDRVTQPGLSLASKTPEHTVHCISRFGRFDGPSIPVLRLYFKALDIYTALLWSGKVSSFLIICLNNIFPEFDTVLKGLHRVIP